jgi:hypothetical protein
MSITQKRLVKVTLELDVYDDLHLEDMDWENMLDLQGDERILHCSIKDYDDTF